jgi:hypothetical protein
MTMLDHLMVATVKFMAFAGGLLASAPWRSCVC